MKKIILLIAITLLLTACGKTETSNTSSGATVDGTASGMVQEDENAKDPDMSLTWATNLPQPWVSNGQDAPSSSNTINSNSGKSEDEIVKDFEKEIDNLLNSIETNGEKK
jgi:hypothetical protein